jgi:outer membrane protein assembly factor BamB
MSEPAREFPNAVVVLKYNAAGTLLWKQNIPIEFVAGSSSGYSFNLRSEVDKAGNLYIGTSSTGQMGFVLIKLNPFWCGCYSIMISRRLAAPMVSVRCDFRG